jgi:succinate dehydrogenase / fumarate reductase cytochrome b subunit
MNADAQRRLHSLTGLFPLGAYLCFHAWEHWPIRAGRDPLLDRINATSSAPLEVLLVIVPLLVHAALGLKLFRESDGSRAYLSPAFRRLQAVTGFITLAFLLWHLVSVWGPRIASGGSHRAYDAMLEQAGSTLGAALHVVALSAVCVHFGQGLSAAWLRLWPDSPARLVRGLGIGLGLCVWLALLDELAAYAGGAPLL